jgi:hypothetical protein
MEYVGFKLEALMKQFFIGENDFRVWLPQVFFIEKSSKTDEDAYNSRKIAGIMSTDRRDRQGEVVVAKGLDFDEFLKAGHFNDNHSQETSAIVGYPERVQYHNSLHEFGLDKASGWSCEGYVLKGTKRADGIWELAKALSEVPTKKLGFSIEGKVLRRADKTIEKAKIRNVAITNCPVNTDCSWDTLEKSFYEPDMAMKAMTAGYGSSPEGQSGGGALRSEDLDKDAKDIMEKKKKREEALKRALNFDDLLKGMEFVLERRPDFTDEAAAMFINHLFLKGGK